MTSWQRTELSTLLGIEYPIVQGPFGGFSTVELTAAVSNAGGLGSFGAKDSTPDQIRKVVEDVRARTHLPFAVNLWVPLEEESRPAVVDQADRSEDFTGALPLEQPTVSHHLRILREAGLVTCERRGTWVYYRLASGARDRIDAATQSVIPQRALA